MIHIQYSVTVTLKKLRENVEDINKNPGNSHGDM
jgi:hypothetical protein